MNRYEGIVQALIGAQLLLVVLTNATRRRAPGEIFGQIPSRTVRRSSMALSLTLFATSLLFIQMNRAANKRYFEDARLQTEQNARLAHRIEATSSSATPRRVTPMPILPVDRRTATPE